MKRKMVGILFSFGVTERKKKWCKPKRNHFFESYFSLDVIRGQRDVSVSVSRDEIVVKKKKKTKGGVLVNLLFSFPVMGCVCG